MEVLLPPMKAFEVAHRCGPIEQLAQPATRHIATVAKYTNGSDKGHLVTGTNGAVVAYVFAKPPVGAFKDDAPVLVAKGLSTEVDDADLRNGYWFQHPHNTAQQTASARDAALSSWINAFQFTNEASSGGRPALRSPQVGALHAIHAHWSTSIEVATVVMPTGTGKTETMLSTLVSDRCSRVLVIVPTDALRTQIANKFLTLGLLKAANNAVLLEEAHRPVVGTLLKKPTTIEEIDTFFGPCNVVVTTSQLAGGCSSDVLNRPGF
ncbi:DEAD/DEAH box helicase family protein [Alicycliphilus denitrificans]|uniref:DEAD/DEAH box helicase family protein n=1 Tax=Alicycliphilus denitrificans TaxID=179636 RepID=UPI00384B2A89